MKRLLLILSMSSLLGSALTGCTYYGRDDGYYHHHHQRYDTHYDDHRGPC